MKKTLLIIGGLLVAGAAAWFFLSKKGSSGELYRYVPEQSAVVFSMDLPSIFKKIEPEQLKERKLWQSLKTGSEDDSTTVMLIEQALQDPKMTGIGYNTNPVVFIEPAERSNRDTRVGMLISIDDKEKFTEFMKKLLPYDEVKPRGGRNIIGEEGTRMICMWDDEVALMYKHDERGEAGLLRADSIMNKEIADISDSELFKKSPFKKSDFSCFINYGSLLSMRNSGMRSMISNLGMPTNYALHMGMNFENGKVDVEMNAIYASKEDEKKMDFFRSGVGKNYLGQVSEKGPLAYIQASLDYEKLFDYLMSTEEGKNSIEEISKSAGISEKELQNMLTGDLCFAFNGMKQEVIQNRFSDDMSMDTVPMPDIALFIGIKDFASFKKLLSVSGIPKENGRYTFSTGFFGDYYLVETKEGVVVTMSASNATTLVNNGKLSDGKFGEASDFVQQHPFTMYVNLNTEKMPPEFLSFVRSEGEVEYDMMQTVLKPLSNWRTWSPSTKEAKSEINFKDNSTNSLKQILDLIDVVVKKAEENDARRRQEIMQFEEQMQMQEEAPVEEQEVGVAY